MDESISKRLRTVRIRNGLNQKGLAGRLGVDPSHISQLEAQKKSPSTLFIKAFCLSFDISEEWLLEGKGPMRPKPKTKPEKSGIDIEAEMEAQPGYLWELMRIAKYVLTLNHPNLTLSLVYNLNSCHGCMLHDSDQYDKINERRKDHLKAISYPQGKDRRGRHQ